ncbi:MAG TPA: EI24 domain-containing protein, partial [Burkholderiaceae bacterium]|nr:EI24 domain-containing protein [Burkholderiaceae bacterium]
MLQWMAQMLGAGFRPLFEQIIVVALAIPVIVTFVLVLVGLWSTPAAVAMVSRRRYAHLERRHGGSWLKGLFYALGCTLAALAIGVVTLPLWLIPPLALVLPPLIWGWLTAKVMGFDALAEHATAAERAAILNAHRMPMLLMGVIIGFLCGIPSLVWTVSPMLLLAAPFVMIVCVWLYAMIFTFSALWFTHYALTALEALRLAETRATALRPALAPFGASVSDASIVHEPAAPRDGPADEPQAGPLP